MDLLRPADVPGRTAIGGAWRCRSCAPLGRSVAVVVSLCPEPVLTLGPHADDVGGILVQDRPRQDRSEVWE